MLIKILIIAAWLFPAIAGAYAWHESYIEDWPDRLAYSLTYTFFTLSAIVAFAGLAYLARVSWDVLVK